MNNPIPYNRRDPRIEGGTLPSKPREPVRNIAMVAACTMFGNQSVLARALGVAPETVNQWVSGVRPVPIRRAVQIARLTEGRVMPEQLRPDFDFDELRY